MREDRLREVEQVSLKQKPQNTGLRKRLILFVIGIVCLVICMAFMDSNDIQTNKAQVKSMAAPTNSFYESELDKRVNYHLEQSALKLQVQDMEWVPMAQELKNLEDGYHLKSVSHSNQTSHEGLSESEKERLIADMENYPYQIEMARKAMLAEQEAQEEAERAFIQAYKERARKAGFEVIMKDGVVFGAKPIKPTPSF